MTNESLTNGVALQLEITALREVIANLNEEGFAVELHRKHSTSPRSYSLIATVGIGENCEHALAAITTEYHATILAHYKQQLAIKENAFKQL